jgi:hypothetical protein
MLRLTGSSLMIGAVALCSGCGRQQSSSDGEWPRFLSGFIETYFEANPQFAVYQGRHEFDGRLPDWTDAGLKVWMSHLHQLRDSAAAFSIDSSDAASLERDYLIAVIDRDLFWLERADLPHWNPEFYTGALDPNVYIAREYAPLPQRMQAFTRYAANLPAALANAKANLRTPMPKPFAEIGKGRAEGLASYQKDDVPQVFGAVKDSALQREFSRSNAGAVKALLELTAWFDQQLNQGTNDYAGYGPMALRLGRLEAQLFHQCSKSRQLPPCYQQIHVAEPGAPAVAAPMTLPLAVLHAG